jgi:hypothetical protein
LPNRHKINLLFWVPQNYIHLSGSSAADNNYSLKDSISRKIFSRDFFVLHQKHLVTTFYSLSSHLTTSCWDKLMLPTILAVGAEESIWKIEDQSGRGTQEAEACSLRSAPGKKHKTTWKTSRGNTDVFHHTWLFGFVLTLLMPLFHLWFYFFLSYWGLNSGP